MLLFVMVPASHAALLRVHFILSEAVSAYADGKHIINIAIQHNRLISLFIVKHLLYDIFSFSFYQKKKKTSTQNINKLLNLMVIEMWFLF